MKKITLLFVAAALLSGGTTYAQSCCKKGHCTKSACKDKAKTTSSDQSKSTNAPVKAESAKKSS